MNIYVASSWRNETQPQVVDRLRSAGHAVYDYRNPHGGVGFHWSEIDPDWQRWPPSQFRSALSHKVAVEGFELDYLAMQWAKVCVLVLPCGRSAHLEAGWFCGAGKPVIAMLADGEPELMYRMIDSLCIDIDEVLLSLKRIGSTVTRQPVDEG